MEPSKFGVTLKSAGSGDPKDKQKSTLTQKSSFDKKPANIKDIKIMFDADKTAQPNKSFGIDYKEKVKSSGGTGKEDDLAFFSQFKFNIDLNKNTTFERTNSQEGREGSFDRQDSNRGSFGKKVIKTAEPLESLAQEPQYAKAKVYSGGKTFQASTDNKVQRANSGEDRGGLQLNKHQASSALQANLAILRTRPGSGGAKKTDTTDGISSSSKDLVPKKSQSDSLTTQTDPPWAKKANVENTASRIKNWEKTSESSAGARVSGNLKTSESGLAGTRVSGNLSPKSTISGTSSSVGLTFTKKTESASVPSAHNRQSSSDSSASSLSSPRLSLRKTSGLNQTSGGSTSPTARSFSPVNNAQRVLKSEDAQPEWMNKSKELVGKFHTKLKQPEAEASVSTSASSAASAKTLTTSSTTTTKTATQTWTAKSNVAVKDNFTPSYLKSRTVQGNVGVKQDTKPVGRVTAKLTKEPLRKTESMGDSDSSSSSVDIKTRQYLVRRMSSEQLQKIKGKFEQDSTDPKQEKLKPKLEIHTQKKLAERKTSLEKLKSPEVNTSKCKTLRSLQEDGKLINIKDRISVLNQGQGEIVVRSRVSSSGSSGRQGEEYNDIEGFEVYQGDKGGNDWPTTSDSEEENMYEYIPATGNYGNHLLEF